MYSDRTIDNDNHYDIRYHHICVISYTDTQAEMALLHISIAYILSILILQYDILILILYFYSNTRKYTYKYRQSTIENESGPISTRMLGTLSQHSPPPHHESSCAQLVSSGSLYSGICFSSGGRRRPFRSSSVSASPSHASRTARAARSSAPCPPETPAFDA